MTQEEFDKAPKIEQVLYDCTGMIAENHSDIIEAMTIYAESEVKKLNLLDVSNRRELLIAFSKILKKELDKDFDEEFFIDEFESNL
jgi:ribonuclease BN (tRNA processing enzyme)